MVGTSFGPYRILSKLGEGGMGEVFRARDTRLNRDVAIKVLPASFAADPDRLRRFSREAQAASALNHPNILTVYDVGVPSTGSGQAGSPYIVSELLEGETLQARLTRGALPLSKAIDVARHVAEGLAAAHEKGIVHRDIKPANLFVTSDGRLKILDFGLAKETRVEDTAATRSVTEAGTVMGTVGYMSPEQVRGERVDPRSDIFSLGAVLYEMAAGTRAFAGATGVETLHAILTVDPPELPAPLRQSSPGLGRIVARCLQKNAAERFHSAHDLGLALELIADRTASGAAPPAAAAQPGRAISLRWFAFWLGVVGAAAALLVYLNSRQPAARATVATMASLTYSGHDSSPSASPDGKTVAFASDRDGVSRIWLKQVDGGGELSLTSGSDDYPRISPDGSAILFVRSAADSRALYRLPLLGGGERKLLDDVTGGDWSPDGRQIAFTRWVSGERSGSVVGLANADGTGARELAFVSGRSLVLPRWSPDAKTIAAVNGLATVAVGFGVDLVNVDGSGSRLLESKTLTRQSSVVWSADSRAVIYSEAESLGAWLSGSAARLVRQGVATGSVTPLLWLANHSRTLDVLGPGRLLLDTRSSRESLREFTLGAASAPRWFTHGNSTDRQPTYSPDGEWVAFSSNLGGNLDLWAVNRSTGGVRRLTDDPANDWDPAYSPDGKRLLFGSNRAGAYEVWAANPDGSGAKQLSHDEGFAQNPQQSHDGAWIVYHSTNPARAGLWRMRPDGTDAKRIYVGAIQLPEISPDSQHVLFVDGLASSVRVVRLADGAVVPFTIVVQMRKATTATMGRARWMPDGRAIAFIGQDEQGVNGVFVQEFTPGRDTAATRRKLGGFDAENSAESFAMSPDGKHMTVAGWEQMFNILIAEHVPDIERRR